MSPEDQQAIDYTKMLQVAYELGLGQYFPDAPKKSTILHFEREREKPHFVFVLATSKSKSSSSRTTNDIVCLDSDDDDETTDQKE